jgi:hypothetical protein
VGQNTLAANNIGLAPYNVDPDYDQVVITDNGSDADIENLPAGTYTALVTDINSHCTDTMEFTIANANCPVSISEQTFSIDENSDIGTTIGTVQATDPEQDQLTFSITSGFPNNPFVIDPSSGEITVNTPSELDFESTPTFILTVEVNDGKVGVSATININLR